MKLGINIKIDVTKIDKSRIFEGQKGKYIDLTTFIDTENEDQYGNHGFISQATTKQERESGVKTPILGNCKVFYNGANSTPADAGQQSSGGFDDFSEDIPFANPYKRREYLV